MNEPTVPLSPAFVSHVQRLHELFDRVVDLPAGERDAEIARLAADAPELAEDLRRLLEHAARTDSPLDSAAVRMRPEDRYASANSMAGIFATRSRVRPWRRGAASGCTASENSCAGTARPSPS